MVEYFEECGTLFMLVPGSLGLLVRLVQLLVQRSFVHFGILGQRRRGGSLVVQ